MVKNQSRDDQRRSNWWRNILYCSITNQSTTVNITNVVKGHVSCLQKTNKNKKNPSRESLHLGLHIRISQIRGKKQSARNRTEHFKILWPELMSIHSNHEGPWCNGEDLNITRWTHERLPIGWNKKGKKKFNKFIEDCHLLEISLSNGRSTWSRDTLACSHTVFSYYQKLELFFGVLLLDFLIAGCRMQIVEKLFDQSIVGTKIQSWASIVICAKLSTVKEA